MSNVEPEFSMHDSRSNNRRRDECGIVDQMMDSLLLRPHELVMPREPWWEELKYLMKTEQCICPSLRTKCTCGRSSEHWEDVYGGVYDYFTCRFWQNFYPKQRPLNLEKADQAMTDTNSVNSDDACDEAMNKS